MLRCGCVRFARVRYVHSHQRTRGALPCLHLALFYFAYVNERDNYTAQCCVAAVCALLVYVYVHSHQRTRGALEVIILISLYSK